MTCQLDQQLIEQTIDFHGHSCPGLFIGLRAAEIARTHLADTRAGDLVCVTETDMCGVDAIQFLTECTFGKGNLIHLDYGKMAFRFHDRASGKGIRLLLNPAARNAHHAELTDLMARSAHTHLSDDDRERLQFLRKELQHYLLNLPAEELFFIENCFEPLPRPARVLESLTCDACGESTMESRTRRFAGKTLCIPCFLRVEQKA